MYSSFRMIKGTTKLDQYFQGVEDDVIVYL